MKVLVLYESKTGYTRRYAEWISEEVKGDLLTLKEATLGRVRAADLLIFGGNIRGSIISGQEKMMRLAQKAGGKKTFYFGVGMRPVTPRTLELLRKNNGIAENLFYFRGGLDQEALSPGDRPRGRTVAARSAHSWRFLRSRADQTIAECGGRPRQPLNWSYTILQKGPLQDCI